MLRARGFQSQALEARSAHAVAAEIKPVVPKTTAFPQNRGR